MKKPFDPVEDSVTPKSVKTLGLIIKVTLAVGLIVSLGWLTLRACLQDGTSKMKKYLWTEAAIEQKESGTLTVSRLTEYNDPELSRLFYIGRIYHTEEIGQLQFMLRYNTLSREYEKYATGVGEFVFELVTEADGKEVARYKKYCYITDQALMYQYYRIAFENVDLEGIDGAQVIIYYEYGEKHEIGRCIVYDKDTAREAFKPASSKKPTAGLKYEG